MPARTDSTRAYVRAPRQSTVTVTVIALHDSESDSAEDEVHIDDDDGYTLSAFGDISLSDAYQTPPPSAKTEHRRSVRLRPKTSRPPLPRRSSGVLGAISPTYSGFRFPDLPTPTSPESEKKQFQKLLDAIKQRERDAEAAKDPHAKTSPRTRQRHSTSAASYVPTVPSAPTTPARRPTLRLDTANVRNTGIPASQAKPRAKMQPPPSPPHTPALCPCPSRRSSAGAASSAPRISSRGARP
ncbi:hypothetical protein EVG20_g8031 [Dentipellis fragilis]|uniref:Uncharacterized protein n=1 Tax=Dentipellis fragilis TaxID=205917 RepID=A0A4Y9Y8A6_9AGAM|nr:hypothetical protein EVG20_g8031 [Dentipellis fragilis]